MIIYRTTWFNELINEFIELKDKFNELFSNFNDLWVSFITFTSFQIFDAKSEASIAFYISSTRIFEIFSKAESESQYLKS